MHTGLSQSQLLVQAEACYTAILAMDETRGLVVTDPAGLIEGLAEHFGVDPDDLRAVCGED